VTANAGSVGKNIGGVAAGGCTSGECMLSLSLAVVSANRSVGDRSRRLRRGHLQSSRDGAGGHRSGVEGWHNPMSYIGLIRREMHGSLPRLVFMSGLGGISNAALLAAINAGAQAASNNSKPSLWAAGLFVVALALFVKTQNYILITATVEIESIIHKLRVRLLDGVRHSELVPMERIGRARIVAAVTSDTTVLTQASNMLVFSIQSVVLIVFVGVYVAYLSLIAFLLSMSIVGGTAAIFYVKGRQLAEGQREAAEWSNRLFDRLIDVLDGFKEVRLNKLRSEELFEDVVEVSSTAAYVKIKTNAENFKRMIFSQIAMYLLLGAVVFVTPTLGGSGGTAVTKAILALLFVVGASFGLVQSIPMLASANAASDRIEKLEADLLATAQSVDVPAAELPTRFDRIEMRNVLFRYFDRSAEATFQVGPVDFTLRRGEVVFITGGNGSGKSTFLKILAGLYVPESGEILLDGIRVDDSTREKYRSLLTAIFVDYHVFLKLYGISNLDPVEADRLLTEFRLIAKTRLTDHEFRTLDLSDGQRKRLALVVALLEKRPLLLLDEWTSDQDPDFRRKFYQELVPAVNQAGATIVAISHDDRYLNEIEFPFRRLRMDEGRFVDGHAATTGA
jgi:putative pyoverdin transport system ATP-binding/permease protein